MATGIGRDNGFGIGVALEHLRRGAKVARAGWNGKGMWLALRRGYPEGVPADVSSARDLGVGVGEVIRVDPYVVLRTAQGSFIPWLCSQADLLAEDWVEVEA